MLRSFAFVLMFLIFIYIKKTAVAKLLYYDSHSILKIYQLVRDYAEEYTGCNSRTDNTCNIWTHSVHQQEV